jgi:hypothetical protein
MATEPGQLLLLLASDEPRSAAHEGSGGESPRRAASPIRPCQTCGRPARVLARGRCKACANYWYRYGRERPPSLWQRH